MLCISSRVKVPKIQRQGLDIAVIFDWDLKTYLNMCAICMYLKPFVFRDFFRVFISLY